MKVVNKSVTEEALKKYTTSLEEIKKIGGTKAWSREVV